MENKENVNPVTLEKLAERKLTGERQSFRIIGKLGEGAYGEVMRVTDMKDQNLHLAMKVMNLHQSSISLKECEKERKILKLLSEAGNHPNVIHFLFSHVDGNIMRLFIENADDGDLIDKIEPNNGVESTWIARHYFNQLMEGVKFIHLNGICHRDIKPENLFLTKSDVLKIGDFGMATVFSHRGKEAELTVLCGTMPYISPQVLRRSYRGRQTDIWSCGIVLVTMLSGEQPWKQPDEMDELFSAWVKKTKGWKKTTPWIKMDEQALLLLEWILNEDQNKRPTVEKILFHPWCTERKHAEGPLTKRRKSNIYSPMEHHYSQPFNSITSPSHNYERRKRFSQPTRVDDLLLSERQSHRLIGWDELTDLIRRMTRFCVTTDVDLTSEKVLSICQTHGITVHCKTTTEMVCTQHDVTFIVTIYEISNIIDNDLVMVDFRRSRGDGLEFQRLFHLLKNDFLPIICEKGTSWLDQNGLTRN
ncbi:hypothetical protein PMAYCL1PPCAC_28643, partial [Pristionchus mayeri]